PTTDPHQSVSPSSSTGLCPRASTHSRRDVSPPGGRSTPSRRGRRLTARRIGAARGQGHGGEDRPDGRRRDPDLQLQKLAADALIAPPRALPAQPHDEVPDLGFDRWPAEPPPPPTCPLLPNKLPVPPEQGLGPHHERGPRVPGHGPARPRQQDSVQTAQTGTLHLPPQHLHLVPKHQ